MGKMSHNKRKRGEQELSRKMRELGFLSAHRSQQYCGSTSSADLLGVPGVHIECKFVEKLSLNKAYEQAVRDSIGSTDMPIVCHRRSREPWLITMSLNDWAKIYHKYLYNEQNS